MMIEHQGSNLFITFSSDDFHPMNHSSIRDQSLKNHSKGTAARPFAIVALRHRALAEKNSYDTCDHLSISHQYSKASVMRQGT
jgi:hypothetical protein